MTIDPTIGSSSAIGALSASGAGGGGSIGLDAAIRTLAADVVGQVAGSLGLTGGALPGQGDIYGLGTLADGIAGAFGDSSAASIGALTRALEDFSGAVATDMAAHADGRTLDIVESALSADPFPGAGDVAGIIHGLDQATAAIDAARQISPPA